jgi:manganese/zinc/iron transport system permease protein
MFVTWPIYLGIALFGSTAAVLGVFIVLKRVSLMADAISHATLPGAVTALWLFGGRAFFMIVGGMCTGSIGAFLVFHMQKHTKLKIDTLLGVVLSVFFGIGMVLLSLAQRCGLADHGVLMRLLLGNPILITQEDCAVITIASIGVLTILGFCKKNVTMLLFDYVYGICAQPLLIYYDFLLTFLLLLIIAIGLPLVGVIVMSTLVIAPAIAARQWSSTLRIIVPLAGAIGGITTVSGTYISAQYLHVPAGPVISIIEILFAFFSIIAAPHRGILWTRKAFYVH